MFLQEGSFVVCEGGRENTSVRGCRCRGVCVVKARRLAGIAAVVRWAGYGALAGVEVWAFVHGVLDKIHEPFFLTAVREVAFFIEVFDCENPFT